MPSSSEFSKGVVWAWTTFWQCSTVNTTISFSNCFIQGLSVYANGLVPKCSSIWGIRYAVTNTEYTVLKVLLITRIKLDIRKRDPLSPSGNTDCWAVTDYIGNREFWLFLAETRSSEDLCCWLAEANGSPSSAKWCGIHFQSDMQNLTQNHDAWMLWIVTSLLCMLLSRWVQTIGMADYEHQRPGSHILKNSGGHRGVMGAL